jgi:cytochrome c-type biogenesis protein CcmH
VSRAFLVAVALCAAFAAGCDRRVGPPAPDEEPATPDLSRIFPPAVAAEEAARGTPSLPPPPPGAGRGAPPPVAGESIRGSVVVAPELAARAPRGAVLFVFARGADGGPPVAARRIEGVALPVAFELGPQDRMGMGGAQPFEGPFQLSARLDADGNATTRSAGDLQGSASAPVRAGQAGVTIVLDQLL